jgi:hypothetical protein
MKKELLYIIIGALCFCSCTEDTLNIVPETYQSSATFFKKESHFDQALIGAYERLRGIPYAGFYMDEMRSDNTFFTYYLPNRGPANWVEDIVLFLDHSQTTVVNGRYNTNYSGIARVNTIVSRLRNADITEVAKDRILGEALFLRAFYYFDLVQHYGEVPLHIEEVISEDEAFKSRASQDDVYSQIIKDLENAIPKLSVVTTFPQSGRATKGAAKMLLAYVYMSKPAKEYVKAESELRDIMNMNYSLLNNYSDVFDPSNKNNSESIFEIQYKKGDQGQQSDWIYTFLPKTTNTEIATGIAVNNLIAGGWNVPTQEMVDSYEYGDLRLQASVGVIEGTQNGDNFTYEAVKDVVGYTPTAGKTYYYFIKKYLHPPYESQFNTNDNWPVYRYSDALLLLAECLVEQGKNNEALPFLNQVRSRAALPALSEATMENIANERRHELAFENHRWTDLIRTGQAIEVMNAFGNRMKSLYGFIPLTAFNVTENRLIYPIPYRELQINNQLVQNPGY